MGAWAAGAFGNDCAMDWIAQLEAEGAAAVTDALSAAVEADEYLEAPEGEEATAAAEVVAAALGDPAAELPAEVLSWVQYNGGSLSAAEARLALEALARVTGQNSELYELWVDEAQDREWPAAVGYLRERLERAVRP